MAWYAAADAQTETAAETEAQVRTEHAEELRDLRHALDVIKYLADEEYQAAGKATPSERLSAIRRVLADYAEPAARHNAERGWK